MLHLISRHTCTFCVYDEEADLKLLYNCSEHDSAPVVGSFGGILWSHTLKNRSRWRI